MVVHGGTTGEILEQYWRHRGAAMTGEKTAVDIICISRSRTGKMAVEAVVESEIRRGKQNRQQNAMPIFYGRCGIGSVQGGGSA